MTRLLTAAAVLVSLTAIIVSARDDPAARSGSRPVGTLRPAAETSIPTATPSPMPRRDREPAREIERIATAYALTARNWSSRTLLASWQRQRNLSIGRYRQALDRARPASAQRDDLRAERASSIAILAAPVRAQVRGRRAHVDVALHERVAIGGHAAARRTRNRVTLRRVPAGWRVTGWTILPGADR